MTATTPQPRSRPPTRAEMQARLAELEAERDSLVRQKRRNLLFLGLAVSLLVHVSILLYLDSVVNRDLGGDVRGVNVEFAILPEEELSEFEATELQLDEPESRNELEEMPNLDSPLELDVPPAAELEAVSQGAMPTLGGGTAGGGGDLDLGGGTAGVQFFGTEGRGSHFAFIVDVSGSMSESGKIITAFGELIRSLDSLPDFANFHLLLFASRATAPEWQAGEWLRARPAEVNRIIRWLDQITAGGGTQPKEAFYAAFALEPRPDVIFFLTDGQIPAETPDEVSSLNRRGKRVQVNTIAFGDPRSQDLLKRIANESGGAYRFVPVGSGG